MWNAGKGSAGNPLPASLSIDETPSDDLYITQTDDVMLCGYQLSYLEEINMIDEPRANISTGVE
jgi:hypothetical protein